MNDLNTEAAVLEPQTGARALQERLQALNSVGMTLPAARAADALRQRSPIQRFFEGILTKFHHQIGRAVITPREESRRNLEALEAQQGLWEELADMATAVEAQLAENRLAVQKLESQQQGLDADIAAKQESLKALESDAQFTDLMQKILTDPALATVFKKENITTILQDAVNAAKEAERLTQEISDLRETLGDLENDNKLVAIRTAATEQRARKNRLLAVESKQEVSASAETLADRILNHSFADYPQGFLQEMGTTLRGNETLRRTFAVKLAQRYYESPPAPFYVMLGEAGVDLDFALDDKAESTLIYRMAENCAPNKAEAILPYIDVAGPSAAAALGLLFTKQGVAEAFTLGQSLINAGALVTAEDIVSLCTFSENPDQNKQKMLRPYDLAVAALEQNKVTGLTPQILSESLIKLSKACAADNFTIGRQGQTEWSRAPWIKRGSAAALMEAIIEHPKTDVDWVDDKDKRAIDYFCRATQNWTLPITTPVVDKLLGRSKLSNDYLVNNIRTGSLLRNYLFEKLSISEKMKKEREQEAVNTLDALRGLGPNPP